MSKQQNESGLIREFFSRPLDKNEITFMYLGYAGVILRLEERVVAFDIANLLENNDIAEFNRLDLLAYTHNHGDHYNRARARRVLKETEAYIVAQSNVAEDLKGGASLERLISAEHKKSIRVGDFDVVSIDGVHPRPISVYRISKGRFSVFHGGDSGYCPVKDYPARIAFLPTGFPSPSCTPESALRFALDLKPSVVIAMHGRQAQMQKLKTLIKEEMLDTTVIIPEENKAETIVI